MFNHIKARNIVSGKLSAPNGVETTDEFKDVRSHTVIRLFYNGTTPKFALHNIKGKVSKFQDHLRLKLYITDEDDIKGLLTLTYDIMQIAKRFNFRESESLEIIRGLDVKQDDELVNRSPLINLKIDENSVFKNFKGKDISSEELIEEFITSCDVIIEPRHIVDGKFLVSYVNTCYVSTMIDW